MRRPRPARFWVLAVLGTPQALLAGSILFDSPVLWWATAVAFPLWLHRVAEFDFGDPWRVFFVGYLTPVVLFAVWYAVATLPARPEAARALALVRAGGPAASGTGSDVPAPKIGPASGDRELTHAVWLLARTFAYLAACAIAGLFWHTPVLVYVAAAVAGVLVTRR